MLVDCVNRLNFSGRLPYKVKGPVMPLPRVKTPPSTDCFLRADKVMNSEFYNKSIQPGTVVEVYKDALLPQKNFMFVLKKYLAKFIANENNPNLPIKSIKGEPKKVDKIVEKLQSIYSDKPYLENLLVILSRISKSNRMTAAIAYG